MRLTPFEFPDDGGSKLFLYIYIDSYQSTRHHMARNLSALIKVKLHSKSRYLSYRMLGRPQSLSGRVRKM